MGLRNLIFNRSIIEYKEKYSAKEGYLKLLPVTKLCHLEINKYNSSLINPFTKVIFGDALKSCITTETLNKLKVVDPVNKLPLQIVLVGSELYINPLFKFKYKEFYMAQDIVLLGRFPEPDKQLIKNIIELLGKSIITKPHDNSIALNNSKTASKKYLECVSFNNKIYTLDNYLSIWESTPLSMYL